VSALGPLGREELRIVEAPQERGGGSENFGGTTHAVGGVVLVIDLVIRVDGGIVLRWYLNTFRSPKAAESTLNTAKDRRPGAIESPPGPPALRRSLPSTTLL
jgi:hypothetical protein